MSAIQHAVERIRAEHAAESQREARLAAERQQLLELSRAVHDRFVAERDALGFKLNDTQERALLTAVAIELAPSGHTEAKSSPWYVEATAIVTGWLARNDGQQPLPPTYISPDSPARTRRRIRGD